MSFDVRYCNSSSNIALIGGVIISALVSSASVDDLVFDSWLVMRRITKFVFIASFSKHTVGWCYGNSNQRVGLEHNIYHHQLIKKILVLAMIWLENGYLALNSNTHSLDLALRQFGMIDLLYLTPLSAISWRPVLVVEEAGVPGQNHRSWASNW